jgi:hypothetical protein
MFAGFAFHEWLLVVQDERIAPKEQIAVGSVYKSTHPRGPQGSPDVRYSFSYGGYKYYGMDSTPQGLEAGDHCTVYFDPDDPTTNSLTEYQFQGSIDHGVMTFFVYLSLGSAALLAAVSWLMRSWKNSTEGDADA